MAVSGNLQVPDHGHACPRDAADHPRQATAGRESEVPDRHGLGPGGKTDRCITPLHDAHVSFIGSWQARHFPGQTRQLLRCTDRQAEPGVICDDVDGAGV